MLTSTYTLHYHYHCNIGRGGYGAPPMRGDYGAPRGGYRGGYGGPPPPRDSYYPADPYAYNAPPGVGYAAPRGGDPYYSAAPYGDSYGAPPSRGYRGGRGGGRGGPRGGRYDYNGQPPSNTNELYPPTNQSYDNNTAPNY